MKFKTVWCTDVDKKYDGEDFPVCYIAENGKVIDITCVFGRDYLRNYVVDGKYFHLLEDAKAYCEEVGA